MKYRIIERNDGYRLYYVERRHWWSPFWSPFACTDRVEDARRIANEAKAHERARPRAARPRRYVEYLP